MLTHDTPHARFTGDVREELGLSERSMFYFLGRLPADRRPPVVGGRRLWSPEHVEALRALVLERRAARAPASAPSERTPA